MKATYPLHVSFLFYLVLLRDGSEVVVNNPSNFPEPADIQQCQEPMVDARIIIPNEYTSAMMKLCTVSLPSPPLQLVSHIKNPRKDEGNSKK